MEIVTTPNDVLTTRAKEVEKIDKDTLNLIEEMKQTLLATKEPKGVGLAAPQVGKSVRIFITKPFDKSPFTVFINPEITWTSQARTDGVPDREKKYEGCLSIPTIWGLVHRAKELKCTYLSEDGKRHERIFKGFIATIIQHEMDHLDGVLFTKRVLEQGEKFYKLTKDEKGEDVFDEIEI